MTIGLKTKSILHGEIIQQIVKYKKETIVATNKKQSTILGLASKATLMTI